MDLPHTRQRVALSLSGEPHVGHFLLWVGLFGLIVMFEITGANSPDFEIIPQ